MRIIIAVAALIAIGLGIWHLAGATAGLTVTRTEVGGIPVTTFRPAAGPPGPVVVIGHGFAGSQQLMQPFAVTLARNGYTAVTFDFPGHGRNPAPLPGGLADEDRRNAALMGALTQVIAFAHADALLGHSMASDIVIRYAASHPEVRATVAVSAFSPSVTATSPRNLLIIVGGLEPAMLRDEGLRIAGQAASGPPSPRVTYGRFADGTARRVSFSGGVEHIGVLYSRQSMVEALNWLDAAFGWRGNGYVDTRGPWLGLLYAGLIALAWPLSALLPRAAVAPLGGSLGWRRLLPVALLPAVLTPLILWKLPTDFLPILLGDYIAVHFAVYGALTWAGLSMAGRPAGASVPVSRAALAVAATALAAYSILAIGLPIDAYVTSFLPTPGRAPLILAILCGTLPYFAADEWLTRGPGAPRGAYALTKLCFLLSLALAIELNLPRLFFLIIIVPVILAFFVVYGLFSTWAYRRTRHPLVGALANALAFAWAIAVTFPLVSR